ncbi:MAG TPA: DUF3896 domain-containing protein [Bacillus bacterium]|nr:DUF3896 domain-containing protein [Bacillus sp. (in: firmicutes)]
MNYQEVKEKLEALKLGLNKLQNPDLLIEEKESIQRSIANYEYIIELTDMNHFERGSVVH